MLIAAKDPSIPVMRGLGLGIVGLSNDGARCGNMIPLKLLMLAAREGQP